MSLNNVILFVNAVHNMDIDYTPDIFRTQEDMAVLLFTSWMISSTAVYMWKRGYSKNRVVDPEKGLLYLATETCDQKRDEGLPDGAPLNGRL